MQQSVRKTKLGIIGLGHIGKTYAQILLNHKIPDAELCAVSTHHPEWIRPHGIQAVCSTEDLLRLPELDGIIICTPHMHHVRAAQEVVAAGIPVLVEKPVAAVLSDAEDLCSIVAKRGVLCGVCFNQRLNPLYQKVKKLLEHNCVGMVVRFQWTMTAWYRSQEYYDSALWRGSWKDEGGGVLLNQCAHHLDLLCWWFGMPAALSALCSFGKHHSIDVEDEATVLFRYPQNITGCLVASTGEQCGIDRLEIIGTTGRIEVGGNRVVLNKYPSGVESAGRIPSTVATKSEKEVVVFESQGIDTHVAVVTDFVEAIRGKDHTLVSIQEACQSLMLANAAITSSLRNITVKLPLNSKIYDEIYAQLVRASI